MAKLLILESPSKSKTVGKFLGKGYKVVASGGHIVDLPKSKLGVDIENGFEPKYQTIKSKGTVISELKAEAKKASEVYLATDPDREGEAISWHLANVLGIDQSKACRVVFNEITKNVVLDAMEHPRKINQDLVDAQQARRVLDRLVGYEISPVLWKKVKTGLSAGRVQSPAVRLIVDREREIQAFEPQEYWSLDVTLEKDGAQFNAAFHGKNGKKQELKSREEVDTVLNGLEGAQYCVEEFKLGRKKRSAPTPFTTSMLQQEASRKLGFTTRRTMKIAQQLYESIDVEGEGSVGLVTYIRTDSLRISAEAIEEVRGYIGGRYGADYLPAKPNVYKSKNNIQDAHEAIRPTSLAREPKAIRSSLTDEQYKLYKLIYERFVACQMTDAVYATKTAEISAGEYDFRATASERVFDGYMAVYVEGKDQETEEKKAKLPDLQKGELLTFVAFLPEQHFTEPPARYTEASLVKELEDKGIGRPSTYAPIISTILDRQYIEREKKALKPTPLGFCVTDFMMKNFPDIVNVHFTADMESKLDAVESGDTRWAEIVGQFYGPFEESVKGAESAERVKVPVEETDIPCEKCGRMMVVRSSRFGKFLACPGYPECKNTRPMPEDEIKQPCPKCGGKLVKRSTKVGNKKFYGCSNYPDCDFASNGIPTGEICPECGSYMITGFRGRVYCMNLDCPTREKDRERIAKKAAAAAEKEAAEGKKPAAGKAAKASASAKKPAQKKAAAKPAAKKSASSAKAKKETKG